MWTRKAYRTLPIRARSAGPATVDAQVLRTQRWGSAVSGEFVERIVCDRSRKSTPGEARWRYRDFVRGTAQAEIRHRPADLPALGTAFLLVVGFTFSNDIVEYLCDVTGNPDFAGKPWLVSALDCLLVAATAVVKWRMSGYGDFRSFCSDLLTGWWAVGAVVVVLSHIALSATANRRVSLSDTASVWVNLFAISVSTSAVILLMLSALGGGRTSLWTIRWLVPLLISTFVVEVAIALWYPVIDIREGCADRISADYFSNVASILAVLLLTLGIEFSYVRRSASANDFGTRAAPLLSVALLCMGELLAFSMLVQEGRRRCGLGAVWHEYVSFVVTAQALALGLATLVWLLVMDTISAASNPSAGTPDSQAN